MLQTNLIKPSTNGKILETKVHVLYFIISAMETADQVAMEELI